MAVERFHHGEKFYVLASDYESLQADYDRLLSACKECVERISKAAGEEWGDDYEAEVEAAQADLQAVIQSCLSSGQGEG